MRDVIEFWQAVEMFSPQQIPSAKERRVFDLDPDDPLPWSTDHPVHREKPGPHLTWRYTVYAGVFATSAVFAALEKVFELSPDLYEERRSGDSALLAFTVSEEGFLVPGSLVLSACAWAMGRALTVGPRSPHWLAGLGGDESALRTEIEEELIPEVDGDPAPVRLDWDALAHCRARAAQVLHAGKPFADGAIRVRCERVGQSQAKAVEHDFLNSFIADDLARVAAAAGRGKVGAALRGYLTPTAALDLDRRVDLRIELDEVRRATDPDRVPLGRWPTDPQRPLALGQQLAVNEATAMARGGDQLLAVNGPPGTGKTTMLRDLAAALVTERAERLAQLADPRDAFLPGKPHEWEAVSGHARAIRRLRPELTGFEMVVASSNNGAVENVTLELPGAAAIDPCWRGRARDHEDLRTLAELATGTPASAVRGRPRDEVAWALIAARLGNRDHRRKFVDSVWWDTPPAKGEPGSSSLPGLRTLLGEWRRQRDPMPWNEAAKAFRRARKRAAAIRDDRLAVAAALDRLRELPAEIEMLREAERTAHDRVLLARRRRDELTAAVRGYEDERRRLGKEREEDRRPFVLRFRARAAWRDRDRRYGAELETAAERLREIEAELQPLAAAEAAYEEARAGLERLADEFETQRRVVAAYRERPGAVLPDDGWLGDDPAARARRELRAPWSDVEWNEARTELFLAALDLHRAFLIGAAAAMQGALDGAMDLISGAAPADLTGDAALAAWQALFLAVPVVSTTFASLDRLFGGLGPEALGWLLVDEAGQATPQAPLGGLWRCRRAVIVGDPLQLEPITTIPPELEDGIRKHFRIDEEWLTRDTSAQRRADRLNRFGSRLVSGAGQSVWVGAPLTVHRRCDHPMFDLSNRIAYDGLMIDATDPALAERFTAEFPTLPASKWIDVRAESSSGHWVPAEGEALDRVLAGLDALGFDFSQVLAVGPFRDVAAALARRARRHQGLTAGTIHTAQGKEADIVILVLGSDPRVDGARRWAASKPNLLNVAVSRARRRLYVIGDRERWKGHRYFDTLAAGLPHAPPRR